MAVSSEGVPIAYSVTGRGEPALVFIHGWAGNASYWVGQVPDFAASSSVITIDLAGHGSSGRTQKAWTIPNFATDVATVVQSLGVRKVVLIGHSLGGPVALEAALLLPKETVAVVGIDTFFDWWWTPDFSATVERLKGNFAAATRAWVRSDMFSPERNPALAARIADAMAAAPPEIALPALADLQRWSRDRFASALAELRVPLGVLQASAEGHTFLQRERASLPAFEEQVMPGAGHFMMLEDSAAFNARLGWLVGRLVAASSGP